MEHPEPTDEEVHALAEELGMKPDELEEKVYKLLSEKLARIRGNK